MSKKNNLENLSADRNQRQLGLLVYLLQLLLIFFAITAVIGIIINHKQLHKVKGCWVESHFRWQIVTFWISLAAAGISLFIFENIQLQLLITTGVWAYYRSIKGLWYLHKKRPAPSF